MATNNASLYGFRWQRSRFGLSEITERMYVASGYQASPSGVSVDLRPGDPVIKVSDGTVALAAAGNATYGIIAGIGQYFDGSVMRPGGASLPGGTTWGSVQERVSVVHVVPVAGHVFEIDCDDNTTATTEATYRSYIGENADITINQVSGSTLASPLLDISTHATTNTLVWRIVDLALGGNLDFAGTRVKLLVTCNLVQQAPWTILGI